jgi:nucleoside-diphosphate-sugar epimerase
VTTALVTGGTGALGRLVATRLLEEGHDVRGAQGRQPRDEFVASGPVSPYRIKLAP